MTDFALSSAIVLALFLLGRAIGQVITTGNPRRFLLSFTDTHLVYALPFFVVLAIAVQFVLRTNGMIGTSVLRYFVAGTYHRPRTEERVFLFIDLEGSTKLAERLGSATYFDLLRRFVDDLTEPVVATRGEIYQYAGDEVVVTWPLATAVRSANCVRCFFAIRDTIARARGPSSGTCEARRPRSRRLGGGAEAARPPGRHHRHAVRRARAAGQAP